ncbi:MAG: flotillin family protein [Angelakisella sp.]|jgi:flotillin|nr:flotillin family protein [Angelakisella sp.]MCI9665659.1 flotillin family protein [Angelakisella sp.]
MLDTIIGFAPIILIVAAVAGLLASGYKKAPPDTAFIVSGLRRRTVIGKAVIKIPFLERLDIVSLKLIPVDVKTSNAVPTADYINIRVDAAVNVKISASPEKLALAAQNFLNQKTDYVRSVAQEVLEGNMREIVGKMKLEEMVSDRQKFAELVKENAEPDLAAMGLDIVSFNVQNFSDENGVIDDLGIDNISQIKKKAAIAKAEADKEIAVAKAEADRQANEARVDADREIAIKKNELDIQMAELKKREDTKRAEADAAYSIQQQEQRKIIEVATANADIAKQEREVELKRKEAEVREQALSAEIRKTADAELYRRQKQAEAEQYEAQKDAEAKLFMNEQEAAGLLAKRNAEAKALRFMQEQEAAGILAKGDAEAKALLFMQEREAAGIRAKGEAEASTIQAKGLAEAQAIRAQGLAEAEAMEKKAEAYQKYNNAAMAEMLIQVLPEIAGKIAEPLAQIDKITIIGGDGSGVGSVADNVPTVMARLIESMKDTTGIDLTEVIKADTYDAKVNRNLNITGLGEGVPAPEVKVDLGAGDAAIE